MESMDIDTPDESNGDSLNDLRLRPIMPLEAGEGLPYAPENFPLPGDIWRWKVGQRIAHGGHFLDRYLYPPKRFRAYLKNEMPRRSGFASKLAVERFIRSKFPNQDMDKFFASFSWKIPCKIKPLADGNALEHAPVKTEVSDDDSQSDDGAACKAGNKNCRSLLAVAREEKPPFAPMPCDICCSEPHFCPECCCILCSKTINQKHAGYSYIKCEAMVGEGYMCGHIAHLKCALQSYMAGTVGGSIGLDAEYYCRRCDAKTDLVPHVKRFIEICEKINSRADVLEILNVGVSMLHGSQKTSAKELLNRFELAIIELKCGTSLEDIWRVEEDTAVWPGAPPDEDATYDGTIPNSLDLSPIRPIPFDCQTEMLKLENEIYQVLQALRKAQESEYKIAEERLNTQKQYLNHLYEQLENERSELSRRTSGTDVDDLMDAVLKRSDQIKKEVMVLKEMEEVANGFGRTPKVILKERFNLQVEEHFHLKVEDEINPETP